MVPEPVPQILLRFLAVETRPEIFKNPFLPLGHGGPKPVEGIRGAAFDDRAGDVAEITGAGIAGKDVEDDGLVGAERAGAALMGIASLHPAGHDGVLGERAGPEAG